jgi:hypothetical protein
MADLKFDEEADAELTKLENDSGSAAIIRVLEKQVFRLLATDPTDPTLRRRRFSNGIWAVTVWANNDEITVLWDGEDLPESVIIRYIGKLPHR